MSNKLNPEKALIFRVTHRNNIPWILENGLHCRSSDTRDPNFVSIGNPDLIDKRQSREVPIEPFGTLDDYIPFYFTPYSVMMYNIKTGWGGITPRANEDIVILVASLHQLAKDGHTFVFTDRHAYLQAARFFNQLSHLDHIDWPLLRSRDFRRDPDDPGKLERYQAEALVHRRMSVHSLAGVMCYTDQIKEELDSLAQKNQLSLRIATRPGWYF